MMMMMMMILRAMVVVSYLDWLCCVVLWWWFSPMRTIPQALSDPSILVELGLWSAAPEGRAAQDERSNYGGPQNGQFTVRN